MTQPDWHPADIIAGLRKKGTSLAEVSRRAGLASSTLANALTRSRPRAGRRQVSEARQFFRHQVSKQSFKPGNSFSFLHQK
ncbi:helix-turn-helix domain-containing protein [Escherichia coli]|uniref:helix-turn-helix domain-containing protein n=1 Tax=Escherichia coli TaxID=562 RepID=UPI000BDF263D|nr:helix-turn-helix domain-containing protein [Escherichia coli]